MQVDLLKLFGDGDGAHRSGNRFNGVTVGVVTEIGDSAHLGRVKVKFPLIGSGAESGWARLSTPWAGSLRGTYLIPEVDDEVLVAFQDGDLRHPYIVGALWSAEALPPSLDPELGDRGFQSKSGHQIFFNDLEGMEKVTIQSQAGHKIVMDDTEGTIEVSAIGGQCKITIDAIGGITIDAGDAGSLTLSAASIDLSADSISVGSGAGDVSISGTAISINGQAVQIG